MKKRTQLILAGAAVLLLAGGIWALSRETDSPGEGDAEGEFLTNYEESALLNVELSPRDAEAFVITVYDEDGQDRYAVQGYPERFPFDEYALSTVFSLSAQLENLRTIEQNPQSLLPYGLETPRTTVTMHLSDGTETVLYIGDETPMADGYYAKLEEDSRVCMIDSYTGEILSEDLYYFRKVELVPFWSDIASSFQKLTVWENGKATVLESDEKDGERRYRFTGQQTENANPEKVENELLSAVAGLYSAGSAFCDAPESYQPYHLDEPAFRVEIEVGEETTVLLVGSRKPDGTAYYVQPEGSDYVALVDAEMLTPILEMEPERYQ